jgi:transketolase
VTLRPADANEAVEAWRVIIRQTQPVCLALTRQKLPTIDRTRYASAEGVARGAYVLADSLQKNSRKEGKTERVPAVILIGTGSEVSLCIEAFEQLEREGISARVVSMPSMELFEQQDQVYRDKVLPPEISARVSVEAGSTIGWDRYVGLTGEKIGMHSFGASAPIADLMKKFGFTRETVVAAARRQLARAQNSLENSP